MKLFSLGKPLHFGNSAQRNSTHRRKAPPPPQARSAKPKPAPKPRVPMCKTLYSYDPQEADELTFAEGEMIEIVNEGSDFG